MKIVRCTRGHYFDGAQHSTCPYCSKEKEREKERRTVLLSDLFHHNHSDDGKKNEAADIVEKTVYLVQEQPEQMEEYAKTVPLYSVPKSALGETVLIHPETSSGAAPAGGSVQHYAATVPLNRITAQNDAREHESTVPVAALLICISGAGRGKEYHVRSQMNYIGRAETMDICITDDDSVSADRAAVIAYDHQKRVFSFGVGTSHNIIRVNGNMIVSTERLKPYDRLTIGRTELLFVPICGEWFDWYEERQ